jgi:hypothetical protein
MAVVETTLDSRLALRLADTAENIVAGQCHVASEGVHWRRGSFFSKSRCCKGANEGQGNQGFLHGALLRIV